MVQLSEQILMVLVVFGLLGGLLFVLRRKGLAQFPGPRLPRRTDRRLESIERLPLTPQHSIHLVRVDGRQLLIGLSPAGCHLLEPGKDSQ